ncbi:HlyD family efflux transporter periplasmic adaptor subunit [Achromobacter sp. ACM02]|nr:HlyD family efflux transporter periplasmic adaptor subunit [Achromobacter sp. ACM02]MBD9384378.1 HlyD family efflux transporter periplasmic adaptor subunit [Achromobacter sp. ACM02]
MRTEESMPSARQVGLVVVSAVGIIESLNIEAEVLLRLPSVSLIGQPAIATLLDIADATSASTLISRFGTPPRGGSARERHHHATRLFVHCERLPGAEADGRWLILLDTPLPSVAPAAAARRAGHTKIPTLAAGSSAALLVAVLLGKTFGPDAAPPTASSGASAAASASMTPIMAPTTPAYISVIGTIEANETLGVSAPFDGVIKERHFSFDTEVKQDQLLLILDPTDLNQRVQEARVAMLKAAKTMQELERWDSGAEVSRARRTFVLARQQVEQTERKVRETDGLVKKGILARNEYDIVAEQLTGFKAQLAAAADDLKATQEKADKSSMEIAKIEYEQARAKHDDLARSALLARIAAPRSGILSKAPASSGQAPATLDAGSRITKGQLLFNVALTGKLRVSARVDEADVVGLATGMPVEMWIDSQEIAPLLGHLASISAQAIQSGNGVRSALFDVSVDLPALSEEQRGKLRVGMTCNLRIETRSAANPESGGPARIGRAPVQTRN